MMNIMLLMDHPINKGYSMYFVHQLNEYFLLRLIEMFISSLWQLDKNWSYHLKTMTCPVQDTLPSEVLFGQAGSIPTSKPPIN